MRYINSLLLYFTLLWENYEALVEHFDQAKQDTSRDQKERCMYQGLQRKITSTEFVLDLALMCDAVQELSELSLELQDRSVDLHSANQKIKSLVQVFKEDELNRDRTMKLPPKLQRAISFRVLNCTVNLAGMIRQSTQTLSTQNCASRLKTDCLTLRGRRHCWMGTCT